MIKRTVLKIYGDVQGVNFRYYTWQEAKKLGLVGWARNEKDGSVMIVAEGEEENLKKLIDYCKQGPRFAKVKNVEMQWNEAGGEFKDLNILYAN